MAVVESHPVFPLTISRWAGASQKDLYVATATSAAADHLPVEGDIKNLTAVVHETAVSDLPFFGYGFLRKQPRLSSDSPAATGLHRLRSMCFLPYRHL